MHGSQRGGYPSYTSDTSYDQGHMNPAYVQDYGSPPAQVHEKQQMYQPIQSNHPSQKGGYYPSAAPPYCGYYPPVSNIDAKIKPEQMMIQQQPQSRPNSFWILSLVVVIFINPLIGAIALWFSWLSYRASNNGDFITGRKRGNDAMWIAIGGIVFSLVIGFSVLILVHTPALRPQPKYSQLFRNET